MVKYCRKCGAKLKEDSEFCEECGLKLDYPISNETNNNMNKQINRWPETFLTIIGGICIGFNATILISNALDGSLWNFPIIFLCIIFAVTIILLGINIEKNVKVISIILIILGLISPYITNWGYLTLIFLVLAGLFGLIRK